MYYFTRRFLARRANFITSDSRQVTEELIRYGAQPERISTFLFGIPRDLYQRMTRFERPSQPFIVCSPRLHEPLYNLEQILTAYAQIKPKYSQVELWFLGDGSLTSTLTQWVAEHHLAGVRFLGRVTPQEFSERIMASHVVISIPSSDGTPVTLLEAMASGSLPIVSDLPVYHDWIEDGVNGLIVRFESNMLADALRRSIEDQSLRNRAAEYNRKQIAQKAIWEEQFQRMLDYYHNEGAKKP